MQEFISSHNACTAALSSVERIMGTCAICLSSGSHASTLTAVDLGIVQWIAGALPSKAGEDSASPLR